MSELDVVISLIDLDVIGITENPPEEPRYEPSGVIVYTRESLNAVTLTLKEARTFVQSIWCQIQLMNHDKLRLSVIFRSPNSPPENHNYLRSMIHQANNLNSHIC